MEWTGANMHLLLCVHMYEKDMYQVYASAHYACPFGAVASVHAWERVGALLCHLARKYLKLAVLRYVDDLFGPER